ncbi:hypothetical protein XH88_35155 [Bradyrhizobium sp. CCBAU 51627]|nr:hypothetical protein [Bradyrhizobium sp. CCBAU 51627]
MQPKFTNCRLLLDEMRRPSELDDLAILHYNRQQGKSTSAAIPMKASSYYAFACGSLFVIAVKLRVS